MDLCIWQWMDDLLCILHIKNFTSTLQLLTYICRQIGAIPNNLTGSDFGTLCKPFREALPFSSVFIGSKMEGKQIQDGKRKAASFLLLPLPTPGQTDFPKEVMLEKP